MIKIIILFLLLLLTSCSICNKNDKKCLEKQEQDSIIFYKRQTELDNIFIEQCIKLWWLPEIYINRRDCISFKKWSII